MLIRGMVFGLVFAQVWALAAATIVQTAHASKDVVLAERVVCPVADATADVSAPIQNALQAVGRLGGGTVFLSAGTYTLAHPLVIPVGVTLRGDFNAERPSSGTVLRIVGGRGEVDGPAACSVSPGGGVMGLVFWYPEQTLDAPKPYPWTIRSRSDPQVAPENQTVVDCVLVNAWRGIAIGPEGNELHTFRNVRICALQTGFAIDSTTDIGRVSEVEVSPEVWSGSGFPGTPAKGVLREWLMRTGAVGADYGRSDWEFIWRLKVSGYATGLRFRKGERGLTNAVMADSDIQDCDVALDLEALNDIGFAVYDSVLQGRTKTVKLEKGFDSIVQFNACTLLGEPVAEERRISIVGGGVRPIRPEPLDFVDAPRPGSKVLDVTEFGAATAHEDNAPFFQRALDAARATGGTVYVPAGFWRFRNDIRVPKGVELRGCTDVPHHTCSGGSVLMPYQGRGEEDGTPFVSLESRSGLRGLCFWYPEQTTLGQVPYPWTIRSLGPRTWLRDVTIGNGWQGADFATHPSDGHRISYLSGCCWRRGLFVGSCAGRGWVEDLQFNPHYSVRLAPGMPVARNPHETPERPFVPGGLIGFLRARLEGFVFRDCADEQIRGTFLYAAREGLAFYGRNRITALIHGTDTGSRGIYIDQQKGSSLEMALAQLVPFESAAEVEKGGIVLAETDAGNSAFHASQFWVDRPTLVQRGGGRVMLDQFNTWSGPVFVHAGAADLRKGQFGLGLADHVVASNGSVRVEDCAFRHGALKVRDPGRHARCRGSSFSSRLTDTRRLPPGDPVAFLMDCEPTGNPRPVEGRIARQGGIRRVSDWSCAVVEDGATHALRLRGHSDDPSYSFLYCEVAAPKIPIYPDTVLEYRFKPMNQMSRIMAIDLAFTDGTVLRESGVGIHPGEVISKPGTWCDCRVPLAGVAGRTVCGVMLKYDSRSGGGVFEALFDDIRFVTPNPKENWTTRAVLKGGMVTFEPPYPHRVYYTLDGSSVDATAKSFTGTLRLPPDVIEFRWSPSLLDGSPSALEFPLEFANP